MPEKFRALPVEGLGLSHSNRWHSHGDICFVSTRRPLDCYSYEINNNQCELESSDDFLDGISIKFRKVSFCFF